MRTWLAIAERQDGAISRRRLLDAGVSSAGVDRMLASGRLAVVLPGTYIIAGSPDTVRRRRWVALLAVGPPAVLSFETGARIQRLSGVGDRGPTVLTVPHSGWQRLPGITVHQISDLADAHVEMIDGMPVTSIPRTVVDLAAIWRRGRVKLMVEDVVAAHRTSDAKIGACLQSVARRGKPGVRLLAGVLDERGPGKAPPASELERSFFELVAGSELPEPHRQYRFPRDDGVRHLSDSAWPDVQLIVEVDGRRWHQRLADMKRDADRDLKAAAAGWQVVRLLHEHVVGAPDETLRDLHAVYQSRASLLGVA